MNIFSYSIKKSDREELEQELGKRLTDVEYNSIVNSVNSIKDNLNKIDLASILSPTETEAPISGVGSQNSSQKSSQKLSPNSSQKLSPNSSQKLSPNSSQKLSPNSSQKLSQKLSPNSSPNSSQKLSPNSRGPYNRKIPIADTDDNQYTYFNDGLNTQEVLNNSKSSVFDKRTQDNKSLTRPISINNRFVSTKQKFEQKYLKYKNKYLSLKQKMEN